MSKKEGKLGQIFVAFSEYPNFTTQALEIISNDI